MMFEFIYATITLDSIIGMIFKIIGYAILIYLGAALLSSLKVVLPFIQLVFAILLLVYTIKTRNLIYAEYRPTQLTIFTSLKLLYLPCLLSVVMIFGFLGEGFMVPGIDENKLVLFSIEEKWHLFKENEYIFHFKPYEIGGFFSNFLWSFVFSFIYIRYVCLPYSALYCYLFPILFIVLALFDIFAMFGLSLGNLIFRLATFLIFVGLLVPSIVLSSKQGKWYRKDTTVVVPPEINQYSDFLASSVFTQYSFILEYTETFEADHALEITKVFYKYDLLNDLGIYYEKDEETAEEIVTGIVIPESETNNGFYTKQDFLTGEGEYFQPSTIGKIYYEGDGFNHVLQDYYLQLDETRYEKANKEAINDEYIIEYKEGTLIYRCIFSLSASGKVSTLKSIYYYNNEYGSEIEIELLIDPSLDLSNYYENKEKATFIAYLDQTYHWTLQDLTYFDSLYDIAHNYDFYLCYSDADTSPYAHYSMRDKDHKIMITYDSYQSYNDAITSQDFVNNSPLSINLYDDNEKTSYTYFHSYGSNYVFYECYSNEYGFNDSEMTLLRLLFTNLNPIQQWVIVDDDVFGVQLKKQSDPAVYDGQEFEINYTYYVKTVGNSYEIDHYEAYITFEDRSYQFIFYKDDLYTFNKESYQFITS